MQQNLGERLLYELEQPIAPLPGFFFAMQQLLAGLVGIITPPLIIGSALGLQDMLPYLVSMALFTSGIGTFLQANHWRGIGAGMICMQGTSFAFIGVSITSGLWLKQQGEAPQGILAMLFGVNLLASLIPIVISQCLGRFKQVFTPIVTGTVIALLGLSLTKVSAVNWCGGTGSQDFASLPHLAQGGITLFVIVVLSSAQSRWFRVGAILAGLVAGCVMAAFSGYHYALPPAGHWLQLPELFPFGLQFSRSLLLPVAMVSLVCILEAAGDITANCIISNQSITDTRYHQRLRGGILADGISSLFSSLLGAFPGTTFAQNNGVIQMTGVASRYVGRYLGAILILLGLVPPVGTLLQQIPVSVIGGITMMMFGRVAMTGIHILAQIPMDRRNMTIIGLSFGLGLGVEAEPAIMAQFPPALSGLLSSAATSGGIVAIILNLLLPQQPRLTS